MFLILFFSLTFTAEVWSKYELLEQDHYDINKISTIFEQFIERYEKKYSPTEYNYRLGVFKQTLLNLNKWNKENPGMYGINGFSDLTFEEVSKTYMGFNIDLDTKTSDGAPKYQRKGCGETPKYIDWRDFGYVTPVKSQFTCGSCYIFSAVGHIEGIYAKKHNTTAISLSEQQVLDCDPYDGGCFGGLPHQVFNYLKEKGLMRADDYPYENKQGDCMIDNSKIAVNVTGGKHFFDISEEDLKDAVANQGPISIGMLFTEKMRHITTGKVYKPADDDCTENYVNHAVLIVGYGRDNDDDYWIIKNSWGTHWADRGYMRIVRGSEACYIGRYAAMAEVD
ncbi:unnamed protein product [Colias eurytheme]|nr:unnamed protein product [Colias eurytheme]